MIFNLFLMRDEMRHNITQVAIEMWNTYGSMMGTENEQPDNDRKTLFALVRGKFLVGFSRMLFG
jgi:hypothetical protein